MPVVGVGVGVGEVPGLGEVVGVGVGVGFGVALLSAFRTELYAAFLLPLVSNSSGEVLAPSQESLSRTPQTVMPVQRGTARQSLTTLW